jgi:hypothetical protein|tara:strand:+ start:658 stop:801 length:144 start_codon:yes stop_codon:yes gene_type:complete
MMPISTALELKVLNMIQQILPRTIMKDNAELKQLLKDINKNLKENNK